LVERVDREAFIETFAGSHRFVLDYLVDEVLSHQPEHVRTFLEQTSVLERLCGPLCDALTGGTDGQSVLEALDRANLFLVPLDDRRCWYRYHHLFGQMLRHALELRAAGTDHVAGLHRRASAWFAEQRLFAEAVEHALAGRDWSSAADLIHAS